MAVSTQDIQNYLAANPNMTDRQIAAAMDQYGVSHQQMAQATGLDLGQVQSRYTAAKQPQRFITDYTGTQYDADVLLNLSRQLAQNADFSKFAGGAFGTRGESIGFDYNAVKGLLGQDVDPTSQVLLDMARQLADQGVTDIGQLGRLERQELDPLRQSLTQLEDGRFAIVGNDEFGPTRFLTPEETARVYQQQTPIYDEFGQISGYRDGFYYDDPQYKYNLVGSSLPRNWSSSGFDTPSLFGQDPSQIFGQTYTGSGQTRYIVSYDPKTGMPRFSTVAKVNNEGLKDFAKAAGVAAALFGGASLLSGALGGGAGVAGAGAAGAAGTTAAGLGPIELAIAAGEGIVPLTAAQTATTGLTAAQLGALGSGIGLTGAAAGAGALTGAEGLTGTDAMIAAGEGMVPITAEQVATTGLTAAESAALGSGIGLGGAGALGAAAGAGAGATGAAGAGAGAGALSKIPAGLATAAKGLLSNPSNIASLLGLLAGGQAFGGGGASMGPGSVPTQGVPQNTPEYYQAVQRYYNQFVPNAPRDVSGELAAWYGGTFNAGGQNAQPPGMMAGGGITPEMFNQLLAQMQQQQKPMYESLSAQSSPFDIAAAYAQFIQGAGGDTPANQQEAIKYLKSIGVSDAKINQAYDIFKG